MSMAQQNHDHRSHRQGQQYVGEAEQLVIGEDGEDHRDRVQADVIVYQHGGQYYAFEQLTDHEYYTDVDQRIGFLS